MTAMRRCVGLSLVLAAALASGCNVLTLPFFIFGPEPKIPASLKHLAAESKEKKIKVVVLASAGLDARPELLRADREIANLLVRHMRKQCKYNEENVTLENPAKVEEFKNNHPNWRTMDPVEIGEHFEADYVIDLEINKLTLYETGSGNQLYRGRAEITVKLVDVKNPDEGDEQTEFNATYPSDTSGPVPIEDKNLLTFRAEFYSYVAQRLSWHFTSHPTREHFDCK